MSGNRYESWNGQYDDLPPSYSLVAQQGPESIPVSIFQIFTSDEDPPPSYSSLDLSHPTSDSSSEINQTTQSSLIQPKNTTPSSTEQKSRPWEVPSYIGWSIFNTIIFPPIGLIALIISLKVCIDSKRNNAGLAWRNHMIARKVNIVATFLGIVAAVYFSIAVPLMFMSRPGSSVHLTSYQRKT